MPQVLPPPRILDAYTSEPRPGHSSFDPEPLVQILSDKFIPGGQPVDGTASLTELLTERWPCHCHFVQYTHPSCTRLLKGTRHEGIRFDVAVFDLDYDEHRSRPSLDEFCDLIRSAFVLDETPNVVYQTRGGGRFVYKIKPIADEEVFEAHYQSMLARLAKLLANSSHGYRVDTAAKDWTRLFRVPLVVRDGKEEFDYAVRIFHDHTLDLQTYKVAKRKEAPVYAGDESYKGSDRRLQKELISMREGNRNQSLFRAAAYVISRYKPAHAESLIALLANKAKEHGLDDKEIESTIHSARKHVTRTVK